MISFRVLLNKKSIEIKRFNKQIEDVNKGDYENYIFRDKVIDDFGKRNIKTNEN